jgi:NADPH:quinone reductase-like Zn-dependent oxidoreductase
MKAAIIVEASKGPVYGDFRDPVAQPGEELITMSAAALSHFTKGRASGVHYSSDRVFPTVVGAEGVGRTQDGQRVYFVLPEAPFGAMAEKTRVRSTHCVPVPDDVDDITAAAIANPGMSSWAALAERAHLKPGESVLINGATGIAGRLAVQIAKYMGAAKVIATGRDKSALEELKSIGADAVIPFNLTASDSEGLQQYEKALKEQFSMGVDVVVDYLWGKSAETVIIAAAKAGKEAVPVRFIHVGGASREDVQLPGAALRSSAIVLMGSGINSIPLRGFLSAVRNVFQSVIPANLKINTKAVPLSAVEKTWDEESGKSRVVFTMGQLPRSS